VASGLEIVEFLAIAGTIALATVPFVMHLRSQGLAYGEARALLQRGQWIGREMDALLAKREPWQEVSADAGAIIAELRVTAGRVAELDRALSVIEKSDAATGDSAVEVREIREVLLNRMKAAVTGLERAHAELAALVATAALHPGADPDPVAALNSRLEGLRQGLAEVARLANPERASGTDRPAQGHP